jgi:hypothetical protein
VKDSTRCSRLSPHLSVLEHASNTGPGLQDSRANLVRRQRESIRTLIPQLVCVRVSSIARNVSVVCRRASSRIKSRAAGANGVSGSRHSADSGLSTGSNGAMLRVIFGAEAAVVAVGPKDVLAVGAGIWLAGRVQGWRGEILTARRDRDEYREKP